jgi:hypothetical protein
MIINELHEKALQLSKDYRALESKLIDCLMEIDSKKVYLQMGYSSLFRYCCEALLFSEAQSYALISVSRKSQEVPELKTLIQEGKIPLFTASRIVSVITQENKDEWLEKASSLTKRELEIEVVKESPKALSKNRIKPVTEEKRILTLVIGKREEEEFRRIQDLLCQKLKKPVSLEETFSYLTKNFIERNDPLKKAERNVHKKNTLPKQRKPTASTFHEVTLRDKSQCTYIEPSGKRCPERKWLQVHHKRPFSQGGETVPENLATLCFNHHKIIHHKLAHARICNQPRQDQRQR